MQLKFMRKQYLLLRCLKQVLSKKKDENCNSGLSVEDYGFNLQLHMNSFIIKCCCIIWQGFPKCLFPKIMHAEPDQNKKFMCSAEKHTKGPLTVLYLHSNFKIPFETICTFICEHFESILVNTVMCNHDFSCESPMAHFHIQN
jgi:hypothetical protein